MEGLELVDGMRLAVGDLVEATRAGRRAVWIVSGSRDGVVQVRAPFNPHRMWESGSTVPIDEFVGVVRVGSIFDDPSAGE